MCELIKFTGNFEWFVLCSRLGESSLQKDCCWYSNSPTTVTNNSLSEDCSHPAITQDKQLLPLGPNHLSNFELSAGSSLQSTPSASENKNKDNFWETGSKLLCFENSSPFAQRKVILCVCAKHAPHKGTRNVHPTVSQNCSKLLWTCRSMFVCCCCCFFVSTRSTPRTQRSPRWNYSNNDHHFP